MARSAGIGHHGRVALPPPGPPPAEGAPTGSPERPAPRASAADVIEALVTQFSQRTAFVRELIQNALDAGAGHIHIELTTEAIPASARPCELDAQGDPATPAGLEGQAAPEDSLSAETVKKPTQPAHDRHLWVRIADDGEGMDREVIEQHLLVLFRSPKEDDRTRIGQFGVGFVSLFAVRPDQVIVDTARHGEHLRLVFDASRRYALAASDEPFEGTRVALRIPTTREQAAALADEVRAAVHHWCRYARADIVIEGDDPEWSWSYEQVRHDFTVDSPVQVLVEDEKFRAAVGLSTETPPFVGYYSHGLTLLETREAVIPGVCFRVESGGLEHTLTRDNVRRDGGHAAVCE